MVTNLIENPESRWPGPTGRELPPTTMTHPKCMGCGEYLGLRPGMWFCPKNGCQEQRGSGEKTPVSHPDISKRLIDSLDKTAHILLDTTNRCNKYQLALFKILDLSDSEMADGDGARRIALEAIGGPE